MDYFYAEVDLTILVGTGEDATERHSKPVIKIPKKMIVDYFLKNYPDWKKRGKHIYDAHGKRVTFLRPFSTT
mgnify:CR=1 FL=1